MKDNKKKKINVEEKYYSASQAAEQQTRELLRPSLRNKVENSRQTILEEFF